MNEEQVVVSPIVRGPWVPRYDIHPVEVIGRDWPISVLVVKWEENSIGERRYVETRSYTPAEPVR